MAASSDQMQALARVYAEALLSLAAEQKLEDVIMGELKDLIELGVQKPEIGAFFRSPLSDVDARKRAIEKMLRGRAHDLLVDALQIMNRKGRLELLAPMTEQYRLALEVLRGEIDVHVRSAVPLQDSIREAIRNWTKARTGLKAELMEHVDPSVLGGVVVQIGDQKFDFSVATHLSRLLDRLMDRAATEIHAGKTYLEVAR